MRSVLVIGAGPVGLTAAVELARRGFHPRIIDKASGHPVESRALAVNGRTLRILEPSGLTAAFLKQGNLVTGLYASEEGSAGAAKTLMRLDLSEGAAAFEFIVVLPQSETEKILAAGLADHGIEIEWDTEMTSLRMEGDRAVVRIESANGVEMLRPDIVIGADGAHSVVRKSLGIGFRGERQAEPFGLVDVRFREPVDPSKLQLRFFPEGLLGMIPISKDLGRFVATNPELLGKLPKEFQVVERLWEAEFHVSFRHVERFQKGNVFLAGDAAHIHSPVGGRGMNLGIEDAAWLAWLLAEGTTERYTQDRLPSTRHVLWLTKQQTWLISSRGWLANLLRQRLLPKLFRIRFVRRRAIESLRGFDTKAPPWLS